MRTKTPSPLSSSDVGGEKLAPKSISLSKRNEIPAPPSPAAARWQAAAGTAIADQTMVVVARPKVRPTPPPSVEKVTSKRRSYYAAMQEEPEEDQCLAEVSSPLSVCYATIRMVIKLEFELAYLPHKNFHPWIYQ